MEIRIDKIKFTKYKMDLKYAAVYVAKVINDEVPMGDQKAAFEEFLKDLCGEIKTVVTIPDEKEERPLR